jgi:hypothetical protein
LHFFGPFPFGKDLRPLQLDHWRRRLYSIRSSLKWTQPERAGLDGGVALRSRSSRRSLSGREYALRFIARPCPKPTLRSGHKYISLQTPDFEHCE